VTVEQLCIATDLELIYLCTKTEGKRHSYIEIYIHVYIHNNQGCFLCRDGSIDIKVRIEYLNVGGTVITVNNRRYYDLVSKYNTALYLGSQNNDHLSTTASDHHNLVPNAIETCLQQLFLTKYDKFLSILF
jgi:hypothetical protein